MLVADLYDGLPVAERVVEQNMIYGDCSLMVRTAAPAAFTFTGATATPVPVNPGSGFGFGTPPSGGKAKDAASPESEKKPELPAAETKPAAAGGFNFGGADQTFLDRDSYAGFAVE